MDPWRLLQRHSDCHAGDRLDHDRDRAAVAILQTKLPDFQKRPDIDQEVVMAKTQWAR
jgi:hypothetical protein